MANETSELFIPIAERIGIRKIRSELQELTFKCLHPDEYNKIKIGFDKKLEEEKLKIGGIETEIQDCLAQYNVKSKVYGWPERYYSIYKKMQTKGMGKVFGLILLKVIVDTDLDCYKVLGILHSKYDHIPSQIKDFIAQEKPNGYKSLHTVLMTKDGELMFKVMIRTKKMDKVCEYGIASSWLKKDSDIDFFEKFERYNSFKKIVLSEKDEIENTDAFIDAIKIDLSSKTTWVFNSDFKPICLKSDKPTAIDFAYALGTKIGHNAVSAIINNKKASIGTELSSGDVVEIIVSETDKSPSRNWLFVVKTSEARKKIKEFINNNTTQEYIDIGRKELGDELEKLDYSVGDLVAHFNDIKKEFDFSSIDDMFASIGYKSITKNQLLKYLTQKTDNKKLSDNFPVEIEGATGYFNINFPKCCSAIPGDEICGVMSRNGISIHNTDCINLKRIKNIIKLKASWKDNTEQTFNVNLKIIARNKFGFAAKLFSLISSDNINMSKIEAKVTKENECEFKLNVSVKNIVELDRLINNIKSIEEIKCVTRAFE